MIDPRLVTKSADLPISPEAPQAKNDALSILPWHPLRDMLFLSGLALAMVNLSLYLLACADNTAAMTYTLIGHAANLGYFVGLMGRGKKGAGRGECGLIWLNMCMFSGLTLNQQISLFAPFAPWANVLIGASTAASVAYAWRDRLPAWGRHALFFVLALHVCFCIYLTIYLFNVLPIGFLGLLALGLGLYLYIPLFFIISIFPKLDEAWSESRNAVLAGLLLPLVATAIFLGMWRNIDGVVKRAKQNSDLPVWVGVAQKIQPSPVSWRYLGSSMFFQKPSDWFMDWGFPNQIFNREARHDPFVFVAERIIPTNNRLDVQSRARALHTVFSAGHDAESRLWSGKDLTTRSLYTAVHFQPELRLASTILTLETLNTATFGQQEAIYTFHLPEGAVVTDLSLWVEGVEEKGHLTTRARATNAYNTIVGGERRDPSVLHWKEGNTVSVRVFPCLPGVARRFKIGFTAPLGAEKRGLFYKNAWFEGPPAPFDACRLALSGIGADNIVESSVSLKKGEDGTLQASGWRSRNWQIYLKKPALGQARVRLNDRNYTLVPLVQKREIFAAKAVYLDVNSAWHRADWENSLRAAGQIPCFVWSGDDWTAVNAQNARTLFKKLQTLRFSLFPFHKIPVPQTAIVVSKSADRSPRLSDLKDSRFAVDFQTFCRENIEIRVFSIGPIESPYLRSLREFGLIQCAEIDGEQLETLLKERIFLTPDLGKADVAVPVAGWVLRADTDPPPPATPENAVVRLAAYHDLMRQIGRQYFLTDDAQTQDAWIEAARRAGVVSPVSSLVVLETQADYKRFDIDKAGDTDIAALLNKQAGAVPEPREWALFAFALAFMALLFWKKI
jgi:XrtN system VIT domain protein